MVAEEDVRGLVDDPALADRRDRVVELVAEIERPSSGAEARSTAALALVGLLARACRGATSALAAAQDALMKDGARYESDKERGHRYRARMQARIDRLTDELARSEDERAKWMRRCVACEAKLGQAADAARGLRPSG